MTTTERIVEAYRRLVVQQTVDMWLRGDIRWCSMRGALS